MTDAFDALRLDPTPVDPSPRFAAALRDRLTTAMETPMTNNTATRALQVTPYLNVRDAAAAIDFYVAALGAVELHRLVGDDGRIGHAEIRIGNSSLMLADEHPEHGIVGPLTRGGSPVNLTLQVAATDPVYQRAIAAGATSISEPADQFYGQRMAVVRDPFGYRWNIAAPIPDYDQAQYAAKSAEAGYRLDAPDEISQDPD